MSDNASYIRHTAFGVRESMAGIINRRIIIVGAGYVGLSTAVAFSQKNHVVIVEVDSHRMNQINLGKAPIYEEGLEPLLKTSVDLGRLKSSNWESLSGTYDFALICVGTPPLSNGIPDLAQLDEAMLAIESSFDELIGSYGVIALRSTVPPGATREHILDFLAGSQDVKRFGVVFNPEFLRQGRALSDIMSPDRIVIGASDRKASREYCALYSSILSNPNTPILEMSIESAELCKYASNAFLSTKVSFTNEISSLAEMIPHASIDDALLGVTSDHRICASHLKPGLGFGGSCLPKDLNGFILFGVGLGSEMRLLSAVREVNEDVIPRLARKLRGRIGGFKGKKISILGLAFKPGTDDTRGSQSLDLISLLSNENADVWAHDPLANDDCIPHRIASVITRTKDIVECVKNAEAAVIMTNWPEYHEMGIEKIAAELASKVVLDGVGVFSDSEIPPNIDYLQPGHY